MGIGWGGWDVHEEMKPRGLEVAYGARTGRCDWAMAGECIGLGGENGLHSVHFNPSWIRREEEEEESNPLNPRALAYMH